MKYLCSVLLLALLFSCGNQNSKKNNEDPAGASDQETENQISEKAISSEGLELLQKLKGNYYTLQQDGDALFYQEKCTYNEKDISISEIAEGSGYWEFYWLNETLDIHQVEEKEGSIYITSHTDEDQTFIFSQHKNKSVWDLTVAGYRDTTPLTRVEDAHTFTAKPCTDIAEIMQRIPESWYLLTEIDGENVLYEPCEDAPGGITIDETSIDFWSGSDPYQVVSMRKLFNKVTITYQSLYDRQIQDSIVMHDMYSAVFKFGKGTEDDNNYVSEQSKDSFTTVQEDCD